MKKIKDILCKLFGSNQKEVKPVTSPNGLFYYGNPLVFTISGIENNELVILMSEDNYNFWLPAFQDSPLMTRTKEKTNLFIHERYLNFDEITSEEQIMEFDIRDNLSRILAVEILPPDHYDPRCGFRIQLKHTLINDEKLYRLVPVLNYNDQIVSLERITSKCAAQYHGINLNDCATVNKEMNYSQVLHEMRKIEEESDQQDREQEQLRKVMPHAHLELLRLTHVNADDIVLPLTKHYWLHLIDLCEGKDATPEQEAWYTLYGKQSRIDIASIGLGVINEDSLDVFKYRPAFLDGVTVNTRPDLSYRVLNWDSFEFVDDRVRPEGGYPANMDPVHFDVNPLSFGTKTLDEIQVQPRSDELGQFNYVPELVTHLDITKPDTETIVLPRNKHVFFPHYFYPITGDQDITEAMTSLMQSFFDRDENGHATTKSIVACIALMDEKDYQELETKRLSKHDD